ncbi:MAG TPA: BamA/TamA family outer membrane protein [Gemmatimonadaceae bacterium]|nr:BamA/TamA family outer membrane protein [Gemmatimonadaceae bacterium]
MSRRRVAVRLLIAAAIASSLAAGPLHAQYAQLPCDSASIVDEIRGVHFVGNVHFSAAELDQHVSTTPSDFGRRVLRFFGTRRCLGPQHITLGRDIASLKRFYADQGFPDAKIDTVVTHHPKAGLDVTFKIVSEGLPVLVDSLAITGLDGVEDRGAIVMSLALGDSTHRFSTALLQSDIDSIKARLANVGYPLASVASDTALAAPRLMRVTIAVAAGPLAHFGHIRPDVTPNAAAKRQQISDSAVLRVLGFHEGDRFSTHALAAARRTLYSLGVYLRAEPVIDTTRTRADHVVDVVIELTEDKVHQLNTEFGWATLDCLQTQVQYSDKALFGTTRQLEIDGQLSKLGWAPPSSAFTRGLCIHRTLAQDPIASDTLNYNLSATFRQPGTFGGWSMPSLTVYSEITGAYQAYLKRTLIGGATSITRPLSADQTLQLGYNLEYGHTTAQSAVLCFIFRACDPTSQRELTGENKRLAVASAVWSQNRTNDPVDPTVGTKLGVELRMSDGLIGSDSGLSFYKAAGDATWYHTLGGSNVVALRFRIGGVVGGAETGGAKLPPPQERLYAGGATSVRGYQQNQVGALIYVADSPPQLEVTTVNGKPDTTTTLARTPLVIPVGGNSLIVGNIEYRIPGFFSLFPHLFRTVFFTDVGDVWTRENDTLHVGQELRWTPGIGVRFFSPVGPIQFNAGYNPYARPLGPLYYSPGVSAGFALYCISPSKVGGPLPTDVNAIAASNASSGSAANCPATYAPARPKTFFRQLAFTLSIGPDF